MRKCFDWGTNEIVEGSEEGCFEWEMDDLIEELSNEFMNGKEWINVLSWLKNGIKKRI